jgi:hypothetical protein
MRQPRDTSKAGNPLLKFALWVVVLLPPCFVAWWVLGELIVAPAYLLSDFLLRAWLPEAVTQSYLEGTRMVVLTGFTEIAGAVRAAAPGEDALGLQINTGVMSYAIPFYAALHFATPMPATWERFARALLVLWLLLALGIIATTLKDLMLTAGSAFMELPATPPTDAIALAYQFCTLIVPPLAPVLLWAYGSRDVPAFRALLPEALRETPAAASDSE